MATLDKEKLEFLKLAKGYKAGEPALVSFDTLVGLIETKDNALDKIQELEEENRLLKVRLKEAHASKLAERKANADKKEDYLKELKKLENQVDKANLRASTFLVADAHRKIKAKKEREKLEKRKIFSKTDLMLGAYYE